MFRQIFTFALICSLTAQSVSAQTISTLMDTEYDAWMRALSKGFLHKLTRADEVEFYLVPSPEVNAFVNGKNRVFFYTGLIEKAENEDEIQGVLAHELAHIHANHILRQTDDLARTQSVSIAGILLGIGAMAAGAGSAGAAILMGSQAGRVSRFLAHSRLHEQEADRLGVQLLHEAGYSVKGMVSFFEKLRTQMALTSSNPPQYLLTHPLPVRRLDNLRNQQASEKAGQFKSVHHETRFKRMRAKLYALTHTPSQTLRKYGFKENPDALYAQAIAYTLKGAHRKAKQAGQTLLESQPKDPFYQELMAEILLDEGDLAGAQALFEQALNTRPHSPLIRYAYVRSLLAQNKLKQALPHSLRITQEMAKFPPVWHQLGLIYGKLGRLTESHLALAEEAILRENKETRDIQLQLAEKYAKDAPQKVKDRLQQLRKFLAEEEEN